MSQEETQQGEALPVEPQPSAETPAADSQPVEQPSSQAPAEGQPAEPQQEPSAPAGEPAKPQEPGPKEFKPTSRRSAQYRIQQLARENAQLRRGQGLPPRVEQDELNEGEQPQNEPQPDFSQQVSQEVDRRLDPVLNVHRQAADDQEINELFSGDRAAKRAEYEPKIREAWKLDQYNGLAASDVLKILTYESDLAQAREQAVEDYKKAVKEAKDSSGAGSSARKGAPSESAWDLSEEEFKKRTDAARARG